MRKHTADFAWNEEEQTADRLRTVQMLQRKDTCKPNAKRPKIESDAKPEHIYSRDIITRLANVLRIWCDVNLDWFYVAGELPADQVPRSLFITQDWLQAQWRVIWFMREHLAMNVEAFPDQVHRWERDLDLATNESGYGLERDKTFICANYHYGPWNGAGWHSEYKGIADELSRQKDPDDAELIRVWPRIVQELKIPVEEDNRAGRIKFLAGLCDLACVRTKGEYVSSKKWRAVQAAWGFMDSFIATDCFVLGHWCKKKQWVRTFEALEPNSSSLDEITKSFLAAEGENAAMVPAVPAEAAIGADAPQVITPGPCVNLAGCQS